MLAIALVLGSAQAGPALALDPAGQRELEAINKLIAANALDSAKLKAFYALLKAGLTLGVDPAYQSALDELKKLIEGKSFDSAKLKAFLASWKVGLTLVVDPACPKDLEAMKKAIAAQVADSLKIRGYQLAEGSKLDALRALPPTKADVDTADKKIKAHKDAISGIDGKIAGHKKTRAKHAKRYKELACPTYKHPFLCSELKIKIAEQDAAIGGLGVSRGIEKKELDVWKALHDKYAELNKKREEKAAVIKAETAKDIAPVQADLTAQQGKQKDAQAGAQKDCGKLSLALK